MNRKIEPEIISKIAAQLPGWYYNQILSDNPDRSGQWLFNRAGLFINVNYQYRENLPRWRLMYKEPDPQRRHQHYVCYTDIGCSLNKSDSAIIADLNSRLLSQISQAYQALAKVTERYQRRLELTAQDEQIYAALKQVFPIRRVRSGGWQDQEYEIENEAGGTLARLTKWSGKTHFEMSLKAVTTDQVIKIANIIKAG